MLKRIIGALFVTALLGWLVFRFPLAGQVWSPSQIQSATLDGQPVPPDRLKQLYWDAQRSRFSSDFSKCAGYVTITLESGAVVEVRLDNTIAAQNWPAYCL